MAGIIGAVFATALSYAVSKYILEIEWEFDLSLMILGILITAALVMIIGAIASFNVLFKKPLSTLRSQ
jgi:predicted lysophospholipase L1 biosynthesis ABC-type transport system permease subunit